MNAFIRLMYALFIAGAVAAFIGVGISSFYQSPKAPDYRNNYSQAAYDKYQAKEKTYERNVAYIVLPVAVVVTISGILMFKTREVIAEGIALGGVATSIYGVITASIAGSRQLRFVAVTLVLLGALAIAQVRFAPAKSSKRS